MKVCLPCLLGLTLTFGASAFASMNTGPEDPARQLPQADAVKLTQAINATESGIFSKTHKYAPLDQILADPGFQQRHALPAPMDGSGKIKDHYLRLITSPDGRHYLMGILPIAAGCDYSVFSDETAAIYQAAALDCDEEHH